MNKRTENITGRIRNEIKSIDPTAQVILFGSRARGDARQDSDWDILILIQDKVTTEIERSFRYRLFDLELETGEVFGEYALIDQRPRSASISASLGRRYSGASERAAAPSRAVMS